MPDVYFVGSNEFFRYVSHTSEAFSTYEYLPTQTLEKAIKLENVMLRSLVLHQYCLLALE